MPGNESVTDNMKSFVGGVALKQAFYNIKTYNAQAISTAITNHNADAAHRHLPAVPTTSPPTGTFSYLTNSQTPAWSTLPTSDAVDSSSSSQLATSKAVSTLNTNIGLKKTSSDFVMGRVTMGDLAAWSTSSMSNYVDKSISFGKTFASKPYVFAAVTEPFRGSVTLSSISTTGCHIRIDNYGGAVTGIVANWLAMI